MSPQIFTRWAMKKFPPLIQEYPAISLIVAKYLLVVNYLTGIEFDSGSLRKRGGPQGDEGQN